MSANEIERTNKTYTYFKDWLNVNKSFIGDNTTDSMLIYSAFLAGWMCGHKVALDEQLESLRE